MANANSSRQDARAKPLHDRQSALEIDGLRRARNARGACAFRIGIDTGPTLAGIAGRSIPAGGYIADLPSRFFTRQAAPPAANSPQNGAKRSFAIQGVRAYIQR
jgi:hypothetical protein